MDECNLERKNIDTLMENLVERLKKGKTCCFTGHRPQSLPWRFDEDDPRCVQLKRALSQEIYHKVADEGVLHFISGMALGVDTWAAEIVLHLRDEALLPITLECALPCETQADNWPERYRNRYFNIVRQCNLESMVQTRYTPDCFHRRNRYMVDRSDCVIAVWDGAPSGTGNTVAYARRKGKPVSVIAPMPKLLPFPGPI